MMNPVTLLDQLLADYASPRVRRALHSLLLLGLAVFGAYEAADGDWRKAVPSLLVALYAAANKANTTVTPLTPAGTDNVPETDESYEQAGGAEFPETDDEPDEPFPGYEAEGAEAVDGSADYR